MMKCKPEQRITPFNAMQHSFLNGKQKKKPVRRFHECFLAFGGLSEQLWPLRNT